MVIAEPLPYEHKVCAASLQKWCLTSSDKKKIKEVYLYSAFIEVPHTQGAQVQITPVPANYTVPASTS